MNLPARGLVGLLAAATLVRAADTPLEEWKFDEPAGTALIEISGGRGAAWTENFEATATDGAGLLVARKPPGTAKNSYAPVSTTGGGKIWLVADLAGWGISGSEGRQGFILGFTSTKHENTPVVVAQIGLDREPSGEFVLRGSALGDGATRFEGDKSFGLRRDEHVAEDRPQEQGIEGEHDEAADAAEDAAGEAAQADAGVVEHVEPSHDRPVGGEFFIVELLRIHFLDLVEGVLPRHLRGEAGPGRGRAEGAEEDRPERRQRDPEAGVGDHAARHVHEERPQPTKKAERLDAVQLRVGVGDELLEVLAGRRRKPQCLGHREVAAGGPVAAGEGGSPLGVDPPGRPAAEPGHVVGQGRPVGGPRLDEAGHAHRGSPASVRS